MELLREDLLKLIDMASALGLGQEDVAHAREYIRHNEPGLCFDTLITQMYEYDLEIDIHIYALISSIGEKMNLRQEAYSFMKELLRKGKGPS